ncbi:MAG: YdjY domain-containing protein [Pirellulaceae bacterium]|nr:hypothetical protein [Planctomycetales bacterium]
MKVRSKLVWTTPRFLFAASVVVLGAASIARADDPATTPQSEAAVPEAAVPAAPAEAADKPVEPTDTVADTNDSDAAASPLTRVAKDYDLWIDKERHLVVIDGKVVLREGPLEMFACSKGTKEHEAIVAVNAPARFVHAALLAIGAQPGKTVQFTPEYVAASGPEVDVWVLWKGDDGTKHKVRAQEWIKEAKTDKAMPYPFVFAGSSFWRDEETGEVYYQADAGDLVCVSNFTTAMLDIPVPSSQANTGLLFSAFTDRIPPRGTPIRLVLIPKLKPKSQEKTDDTKDEKKPS